MCEWHSGLKTMTRNESELFQMSGMCPIVKSRSKTKGTAPLTSLDHVLFCFLSKNFFFFFFPSFSARLALSLFDFGRLCEGEKEGVVEERSKKKKVLFLKKEQKQTGTVKELRPSTLVRTRKMVLCLSRVKSEETLMEARLDTDVQIVRTTWV